MKIKTLIVATFISLFASAIPVFATETNTPATNNPSLLEQAKTTAHTIVATNLNEVVTSMLQGVKTASGEIYDASKTAIIKSVDFASEQAPLVVKEFLHWKMAQAVIYAIIWIIPSLAFFWFARKARLLAKSDKIPENDKYTTDKGDLAGWKWFFRIVGIILLMINLSINGMTITQILVAPRVYLIEYVVNSIQGMQQHHN